MRLLIDIDEQLFEEVRRLTGAKTKKEAIVISMAEYVRNYQKNELLKLVGGGYQHGMTLQQLLKLRRSWKKS